MIRVTSNYLRKADVALLKRYCNFVMLRMVRPGVLRKANINITILKNEDLDHVDDSFDLKEYGAWVTYDGVENGKKKFSMVLNARRINRRAKKQIPRLKSILLDSAHELVHIKQYLNNELFDYVDGKARYKGEIFPLGHANDEEAYYDSPWEIEAYGREYGMYKLFSKKIKQEQKLKNNKK